MKKIIALILAVALMLGAMPFAFAAEHVHDGDCYSIASVLEGVPCSCGSPELYYYHLSDGRVRVECRNCGAKWIAGVDR